MARTLVISTILLAFPLACTSVEDVQGVPFDTEDDVSPLARMLKGKDVGGMDLNDLVLMCAGIVVVLLACAGMGLCWRHHKEAQIDPYTETLWRFKHNAPICVRSSANPASKKSNHMILPGAVLRVQNEITAKDGSKHLKLADHSGFLPEIVEGVGQVMDLIMVTPNAEAMTGFSGSGQSWEFFLNWGWAKYDLTNSKMISAAKQLGVAAVDSPPEARVRTIIDLVSMQQVNMVTGTRRAIRLHRPVDKEEAPDNAV